MQNSDELSLEHLSVWICHSVNFEFEQENLTYVTVEHPFLTELLGAEQIYMLLIKSLILK